MSSPSRDLPPSRRRRRDLVTNAPAAALATAAGLHLAALPGHAGQGWAVASFFLATAAFQLTAAWVVALGGVDTKARAGIAAGNLALVALWVWSRSAGLPLGDHTSPEAASWLDGLAVATELIAVAGLYLTRTTTRARRTAAVPGAALLTIMVLTGAGAAQWLPANHASHHGPDHEQEHPQQPVNPRAEDDHSGTGLTPAACPTCETQPDDGDPSHDAAHAHP